MQVKMLCVPGCSVQNWHLFPSFLQMVHVFFLSGTLYTVANAVSSEVRAQCSHGKDSLSPVLSWQAPQWGRGDAPRPHPGVAGTELCL